MFGSYAKGRATVKSDLDLLVVMPTDAPALVRASEVEPYLGGWAVPVASNEPPIRSRPFSRTPLGLSVGGVQRHGGCVDAHEVNPARVKLALFVADVVRVGAAQGSTGEELVGVVLTEPHLDVPTPGLLLIHPLQETR
jgi:hypothetical protein